MKKNAKTIIAVIVLAVLAMSMFLVWHFFGPDRSTDSFGKTVTVTVIHGDGSQKEFVFETNEEYLRGALEQESLVQGDDGEFGLFITAVDGEAADSSAEQWWCVCDGSGEMMLSGVEAIAIHDGDAFQLVLKTGYDEF